MDDTKDVNQDSSTDKGDQTQDTQDQKNDTSDTKQQTDDKTVPYERFKEVNDELQSLKKGQKVAPTADTIDLIKLGKKLQDYSDAELDFVTEFSKSKKPEDILKALDNEFVKSGIMAYRAKVEKEKGLKPDGTQMESDKPKTLKEQLGKMNLAEKEEFLKKMGGYRDYTGRKSTTFQK